MTHHIVCLALMTLVYYSSCTTEENVVLSSNNVSDRMYKILGSEEGNKLLCPVSVNIPLSLVYQGAEGETALELKTQLRLSSPEEVKSGYRSLITKLSDDKLKLATRLYPGTGFTVKPKFLKVAQEDFGSGVEEVDYSNPKKAAETINTFVKEKTENKINNLIDPSSIDGSTVMIIVNAAHFKDNWRYPFNDMFESDFHISSKDKVKAQMMTRTEHYQFKVSESLNAKIIQIPFEDGNYSMVIVLPNEVDGLHQVENKLTSFDLALKELKEGGMYSQVLLRIPKFKIEATLDLKSVLMKMGITTMFSSKSDLSGLSDGNLAVSQVIQKTYIDVNEHGVEAAAATALEIEPYSMISYTEKPKQFIADHPFLFTIEKDGLILFHGRVTKV